MKDFNHALYILFFGAGRVLFAYYGGTKAAIFISASTVPFHLPSLISFTDLVHLNWTGCIFFFPPFLSSCLQVICWVLGEYGTADGKFSASYITGKLCDVAEAHSNDDTVKVISLFSVDLYTKYPDFR